MPNPLPTDLVIRQAISVSDIDAATSCFRAYTEWLNMDLAFQDFGTEISTLPGKYAAPKGALLLACDPCSQEVLGCIAMRPLDLQPEFQTKRRADAKYCELKRLYVYPSALLEDGILRGGWWLKLSEPRRTKVTTRHSSTRSSR